MSKLHLMNFIRGHYGYKGVQFTQVEDTPEPYYAHQMAYRLPTVFEKSNTGIPLCSDPMIHNIILPQIGLPNKKNKNNTGYPLCLGNSIQGDDSAPIP